MIDYERCTFPEMYNLHFTAREAFEEGIGYHKLLEHVTALPSSKDIVCALLDMVRNNPHWISSPFCAVIMDSI